MLLLKYVINLYVSHHFTLYTNLLRMIIHNQKYEKSVGKFYDVAYWSFSLTGFSHLHIGSLIAI